MRFLPIIERELRVAGRKPRTYWGRVGSVAVLTVIVFWVLLASINQSPATIGQTLFYVLGGLTAFICAFAGLRLTSDCLSVEKREGTLGLLFLTDLRGVDIAMGKLGAATIQALLNLLAVFPLFALPFLLGGVTLKSFGLLLVALLALLALSLSFGLLCSVVFRDDRTSLGAAVLLMVISLGGPPLALAVLHELNFVSNGAVEKLVGLSSGAPIVVALSGQSTNPEAWHAFVLSGFTTAGEILVCLVMAAVALPAVFKREAMGGGPMKKLSAATFFPNTDPTDAFRLSTPRRHLLDLNPVVWLCQRGRFQQAMPWLVLGILGILWLGGLLIWPRDWLDPGMCMFTAFVLHTTLKFLVASSACRQFNQDRNSGAIELLLCTSMTVPDILRGQWLAVTRQFRGPLAAVLAVDLLLCLKFMRHMASSDEITTSTLVWFAGIVALLTDLVAMVTLSMWLGLTNRRANAAVTKAVARVMGIPWAVFIAGMSFTAILPFSFRGNLSAIAIVLFWLALSVGNAIAWFVYASGRLRMGFRSQAIGQHKDEAGFFARLFGGLRRTPPPLPTGST
jgi:hypothetical protein